MLRVDDTTPQAHKGVAHCRGHHSIMRGSEKGPADSEGPHST